ncbi:MAG TPA: protein kinase [Kofleriaceae bacterium]|nr:protein kinase [Kofleriaceae bacterium]
MLHLAWLAPTGREQERTHARPHRALPRRGAGRTQPTSSPARVRAHCTLAPGELIGERYRVLGFLGQGGMGTVYRVFDHVLDSEFALKLVCDRESLREEVRLAQQVSHRNVCRTYDLEQIGSDCFVKMEYIAGETLNQHLARVGTLTVTRGLAIVRAITHGLAAAHARGIVHRDLKPSNVMLDGERVVLVDFGLATRPGESDRAGTPEYMSPEQLAGGRIDARSDLYALGCVAFEILAGVPPASAGTTDVRVLRPDVPRTIARSIAMLLATDPAVRVAAVVGFAARRRRARLAAPIAAAAIVLAVAAAAWATRPAPWEPRIVDLPSYEENADDPSLSPDGASFVFSSDRGHRDVWGIYLARIGDDRGEPRLISPPQNTCLNGRWTHDGRAVLMSCFIAGERRILRQPIAGGAPADLGPGWSVDDCGDALAVVVPRPTGAAIVSRAPTGRDTELVTVGSVSLVRCDRSGQHVLYLEGPVGHPGFGGDLAVVDRDGHARELDVHGVDSATFTPAGTIVLAMHRGSSTSLYETTSEGGELHELTPHEQYAAAPDVASDGRTLLFDRDRTAIPLFELARDGAVQKTFRFERLAHVVAAPDGRTLVVTRIDDRGQTVVAIDPHDFLERDLASGEALFVSRAGRVVFRADDDPRVLRAIARDGTGAVTIASLAGPVLDAAEGSDGIHVELDRDGKSEAWLVARDGRASFEGVEGLVMPSPAARGWRVVRRATGTDVILGFVAPGRPLSEIAYTRAATWGHPAWSGDGELAYCDTTACRRLDVATGRDVEVTPIDAPGKRPITVAGDGRHWFITSSIGHVTRERITNFAERPTAR